MFIPAARLWRIKAQVLVISFMNLKKFSKTEIFFSKNSDPLLLNSAKNASYISEISKRKKIYR
jgi:hypothetical protein